MLGEIKSDLEWGRKVGGRPQENLDMEQVNWMIEQAEKVKRYEIALKEIADSKEDSSCNDLALKYEVIAQMALIG